jgi:hypothetical protein
LRSAFCKRAMIMAERTNPIQIWKGVVLAVDPKKSGDVSKAERGHWKVPGAHSDI